MMPRLRHSIALAANDVAKGNYQYLVSCNQKKLECKLKDLWKVVFIENSPNKGPLVQISHPK
jgi:hypothetical protein